MTAIQPPAFMQNLTNHTAETDRGVASTLLAGSLGTGTLRGLGGVHTHQGDKFVVTQNGAPNMSVNVGSGTAFIPGTEGTKQGVYTVVNDATVNVPITAADPAQPRIDVIVLKVRDQVYSGASNDWVIDKVTGVAAASPTAPAVPANSFALAHVSIPANDTAITDSQISDQRRWAAALGGTIFCTSTTRPGTTTVPVGQEIYELDTTLSRRLIGSTWKLISPYRQDNTLTASAASITFSNIPASLKTLTIRWCCRGDTAAATTNLQCRVNGDSTANYFGNTTQVQNVTTANGTYAGGTSFQMGSIFAATTTAGQFTSGEVVIPGWDLYAASTPHAKMNGVGRFAMYDNAANSFVGSFGFLYNVSGPYTSLTLFPLAGNFVAGSQFTLEGWD